MRLRIKGSHDTPGNQSRHRQARSLEWAEIGYLPAKVVHIKDEDTVAAVAGSNVGSAPAQPLRVIPERGQVGEDFAEAVAGSLSGHIILTGAGMPTFSSRARALSVLGRGP